MILRERISVKVEQIQSRIALKVEWFSLIMYFCCMFRVYTPYF